ncbi:MAG: glucokinase [Chloroflexota bacterium]|jgi:glucokinase|nr:glucokinase [Chloroflexota bacterium]
MSRDVVAVDLGGTHMRRAAISPDGVVSRREAVDTPVHDAHPDRLVDLLRTAREESGASEAVVGLPGRINYADGRLEYAPHLPPSWITDLSRENLSNRSGLTVHICNDAEMAAAGEAVFGAGKPFSDVVYMTISTGIGAGVVQHGRLVHGRRSMPEPGHTIVDIAGFESGAAGFMEDYASGSALGRRAREVGLGDSGSAVLAGLERGDPEARLLWQEALRVIQAAVYNMALWFSPQVIVIGGGIGLNAPGLIESLREWLGVHPPPGLEDMRVERAALGDDAGLIGAAAYSKMFGGEPAG